MSASIDRNGLTAILEWYQAMGVDAAVGETAIDWRRRGDHAPGAELLRQLDGTVAAVAIPPATPERSGTILPRGATPAGDAPRPKPASASPGLGSTNTSPRPGLAGSSPARPGPPSQPVRPEARALAAGPPDEAETAARTAARSARTMNELAEAIRRFDGCSLKATAKNTCVYRGAATSRLVIIGEAPGREEDLEGKPFVGRAGQLLDRMLAAIGMTEADAHITNIVYWRPPGNRTPTPHEAAVCRPFLERQIALAEATHVLLLGGAAAKHVLDVTDGIMRIRGRWNDVAFGLTRVKAMATLHPAYLLRTPAAKRLAWRDLLALKAALAQNSNRI